MRLEASGVEPVPVSNFPPSATALGGVGSFRSSRVLLVLLSCFATFLAGSFRAADNLVSNGGFENGFIGWTRWGKNADLITLDTGLAHSGTNSARIQHGHNALYFNRPLNPGQAYELRFAYRLTGGNPSGQVSLGFSKEGGPLRSAGAQNFKLGLPASAGATAWTEFSQVFLPTAVTVSCQFSFTAGDGSTLWLDDVSLRMVPRPAELAEPTLPWEGLKRRTPNPLFKEFLTKEPGHYTVVSWAHDLNPKDKKGFKSPELEDDATWQKAVLAIFKETGEAGMGFMDLPGRLDAKEPWRTAEFHREQFRKFGVRYDVFSENSGTIAAGLKNGAELLNATAKDLGRKPAVSWVDPAYVEAQCAILRKLGAQLRGEPFVGYYYGKDEPSIHIPEGTPDHWGAYGRTMAKEVLEQYGYGRFAAPLPREKSFLEDPNKPLRWIAYNRWMNDKFIDSRCRLSQALHEAHPGARYSPANYWFMSGFQPYDFSRLAACSDLMECDPYASSAERNRGRGVFNHGFGAKFMSDLTGKPVRVVAQAFNYAGYDMNPEDLREWVSQSLRCGASAIDYYEMDSPRWTDPARWKMMLYLSGVITRMNRIALPRTADTAVLYTLYTHMSQGPSTSGDQVYAAHALLGELAGSWFQFVSDAQLERGERSLSGYKAVYLPLAKYMTPTASKIIEDYVRGGGVLVCGDAEAFSFDLSGNDTSATHERILGIKTLGPKSKKVNSEEAKARSASETPDRIILKSDQWGLPGGTSLRLFDLKLRDEAPFTQAHEIALADPKAAILGTYSDGSPAIVSHKLGKGRVITFAANPFAPQVTVDASSWPTAFKGLQQSLGCKVDQPIWHFALPAAPQ
jgi:Carbohydrate binding domain